MTQREVGIAEMLGAEELQVARFIARGATSREAAAALFMSPKTVRHHLERTNDKLGLRLPRELANLLDGEDDVVPSVRWRGLARRRRHAAAH